MTLNPYARSMMKLRTHVAGTALAALLCAGAAQASTMPTQPPGLSVQAQSFVEVEPDKASLSARLWENTPAVSSLDDSEQGALGEARQRLEERSRQLIETMEEAGLSERAISAGSLNVYQEQMNQPQGQGGEQEMMVRTRVERPFDIELSDIDRLNDVLDALVDAGVNALDGVQFDLKDREAATDEALVMALEKAQRKAELMAQTLGAELGDVQHIAETQAPVFQPRMMAMRAESAPSGASDESNAEYRPGIIRIDAGVNVEWALAGQNDGERGDERGARERDARDHQDTDAAAQE
ncbi:SIMPL domain-containing protein [Halomonas sp. PAMB 3264]|uniref:SIMPL domain-containing protein n=1 Tax=Halomonas sp. PAMB 3264 TaxID=3075222 RepID=UPI00289E8EAF|nr:SIMPL domain-containing protein [Halomonas sp. PAMB 3264]WNL41178.1 SIMPL domain-containing protein [Halomonas sp. PAMB 3264]